MADPPAVRMVPVPDRGRVVRARRRVRFGDVSPGGRCRFDALADYVQDVAGDDTADAGLVDEDAWVVRRSVFDVRTPGSFREVLDLATFCSGLGARWAERRVALRGERGADIDACSLWVRVDPTTGRPRALAQAFVDTYGEAAAGRKVSARLQHGATPPGEATVRGWEVRFADFDLLGHVNNAASWAVVEEVLSQVPGLRPPYRAELEYREPIERGATVAVAHLVEGSELRLWVHDRATGVNHLSGRVAPLERRS